MKIALIYSYDGSKFDGSQTQPNLTAVEDSLNLALTHVGIFENVLSSSRTDKDVHALAQVSTTHCGEHFSNLNHLRNLINRHAHPNIHIKKIIQVDESFQVRFDAKFRTYRYILNHNKFDPFSAKYCYFCAKKDINRLNLALKFFVGKHDFSEFMKTGGNSKNPVKTINYAFAYEYKNLTIIKFKSSGFLRSQVRMMVANALKSLDDDRFFKLNSSENGSKFNLKSITKIPSFAGALYLHRVFY